MKNIDKRMLIITLDINEQALIERILNRYCQIFLKDYSPQIEVQSYSSFNEPEEKDRLGHGRMREIFAAVSGEHRYKDFPGTDQGRLTQMAFDASIDLLRSRKIPSIIYGGNLERKQAYFRIKLEELTKEIINRINEKDGPASIFYI